MDERMKKAVNALEDDIVYAKKENFETVLINLEYAELILQRIGELEEKLEIAYDTIINDGCGDGCVEHVPDLAKNRRS